MLFHLFCEFADGSAKYLHLRAKSETEAHREAIRVHSASVVLFIINSLDPVCRQLKLECNCTGKALHSRDALTERLSSVRG